MMTATERRALSRRARDAFPPMGVYLVRDKETGRVLVASSRNVPGAINRASFELRLRSHADPALQAAWNQGGPERVEFAIVELLKERDDPDFDYGAELQMLEQLYREELA